MTSFFGLKFGWGATLEDLFPGQFRLAIDSNAKVVDYSANPLGHIVDGKTSFQGDCLRGKLECLMILKLWLVVYEIGPFEERSARMEIRLHWVPCVMSALRFDVAILIV